MFSYPRQTITTRRLAPNVPLFDPSGDARCTGWWRADRNVTVDAYSCVSGWTSMLASARTLAPGGADLAIYTPDMTHGFPSVCQAWGTTSYATSGLSLEGDTGFSLTFITRVPSYPSITTTWLWYSDLNVGIGIRDYWGGYLNVWGGGTVTGFQSYAEWGSVPAVITYRVGPVSATNSTFHHTVTYNAALNGMVWDYGSGTAHPASTLSMGGVQAPVYWHELIFFRTVLDDAEVLAMHQLLMRQYGLGV
jgi:hypothetical protein